jgi:hypothetical protein
VTEERLELEPLPTLFGTLPTPTDLKRQVLEAIDGGYNTLVRARGEVTRPEDTYEVQRRLASAVDTLTAFEGAFSAGRKALNSYQKDEFELALGDREITPRESMRVPDREGDLRVAADTSNSYDIDAEALMSVAVASTMGSLVSWVEDIVNGDDDETPPDQLESVLVQAMINAMRALVQCGKFEPQVTKTRAYADTLARDGFDGLAAAVNSTIKLTVKLKGVKVERKAPK